MYPDTLAHFIDSENSIVAMGGVIENKHESATLYSPLFDVCICIYGVCVYTYIDKHICMHTNFVEFSSDSFTYYAYIDCIIPL